MKLLYILYYIFIIIIITIDLDDNLDEIELKVTFVDLLQFSCLKFCIRFVYIILLVHVIQFT